MKHNQMNLYLNGFPLETALSRMATTILQKQHFAIFNSIFVLFCFLLFYNL